MLSQVMFFAAFLCLAAAQGPLAHVAHAPQPYNFGYDVRDAHSQQYRQEHGNGAGGVTGSYGFTDARGVRRQVHYVADHAGFRARVRTNEPGTTSQNPAAVEMISDAHYAGGVPLEYGHGNVFGAHNGFVGHYGYGGFPYGHGYGFGGYGYGAGHLGGLGHVGYGY